MRGSMLSGAALCLALLAPPRTATGGGTIDTTGATIAVGTAPAPGTKTIDAEAAPATPPALPSADPLGSIGTISGSIPGFANVGGVAPFVGLPPTQTLPGGNYSFTTYNVPQGTTVSYTGAVTIQTAGDVQLDGLVTTTTTGASITILCGGNLRIVSHAGAPQPGVSTTGPASPIVIDVNGTIATSSADASVGWVDATAGSVSLTSHAGGALVLGSVAVRSRSAGGTTVLSAGSVAVPAGVVRADTGDVTVRAYGGTIAVQGGTLTAGNHLVVESTGTVSSTAGSLLNGQNSATVTAFGGDLSVGGGGFVSQLGGTGDVTVRASGNVVVGGASTIENLGTGHVAVVAFGGGASLEAAGSSSTSAIWNHGTGDVAVRAAGAVLLAGSSLVSADAGNVTLASTTAGIELLGDAEVQASLGVLDARAAASFTSHADATVSSSAFPAMAARSLLVSAASGISLDADPITAQAGGLALISNGAVAVGTDLTAGGTLSVQSVSGDVHVAGRTLTTGSTGTQSGDVLVESYGASATIHAANATIRSGDHAVKSGDVTLAVHVANVVAAPGGIVPRQVKVRLAKKDPSKSRLTADGVIDTGPDPIDLTGAATLTLGTLSFPVTLDADAKGRPSYRDAALSIVLTPSKVDSSRTAFTIALKGDLGALFDATASGELAIRLEHAPLDAHGTVRVANSTFVRNRRRAALLAPVLYVASAHATLKAGAKDSLDLVAGFSTDGSTPAAPRPVTVSFGPNFSVTVAAAAFRTKGAGHFVASDPSQGVQSLVVDYASETVTFRGRKIELDPIPAGLTTAVRVAVAIGQESRSADVRVAHRGGALIY